MQSSQTTDLQSKQIINNNQFIFNIDRGGTFTDFYVQQIQTSQNESSSKQHQEQKNNQQTFNHIHNKQKIVNQYVFKFPSQSSLGQGPIIGIKNFLIQKGLMKQQQQKIPIENIYKINLGTTIATNALLERKGYKNCMILTKGFKDLLTMRHLARPNIFDLKCQRKTPLFTQIIQADQRVYLQQPPPQIQTKIVQNLSNNANIYVKEITQIQIQRIAQEIKQKGYQSVGIAFCHSLIDKSNEQKLKKKLLEQNIQFLQISSSVGQMGYLKKAETTNLNVFLGPIMRDYFKDFVQHFQQNKSTKKLDLKIIKSDGGFVTYEKAKPSEILLSGPAGGLIGYSSMIQMFQQISDLKINNLIGLDMGGTSTDISRVQNQQLNIQQFTEIESIFVCSPHLQIDTIAAGGGSKLTFENGLFKVGPQSVGSNPGPVCYGLDSQLALTDANVLLNRIDATYFPKIFGKGRNEGLNLALTKKAFQKLTNQINNYQQRQSLKLKSSQQIAQGFITIANQLMAKSARKFFTFGNPEAFVIFGSAGGQHCCDLAEKLDINNLFIHRYSGVLSAYGLSKAPETKQVKIYFGRKVNKNNLIYETIRSQIESLIKEQSNFQFDQRKIFLLIGYVGTNYEISVQLTQNLLDEFQQNHKKDNGFLLPGKQFRIQYIRIKYLKYPQKYLKTNQAFQNQDITKFQTKKDKVFYGGNWNQIPFYDITKIKKSNFVGPAMLISKTVTIFLKQNWHSFIENDCIYLKRLNKSSSQKNQLQKVHQSDPITLTLYSTRLMSIAEEMGKVLQRISISTNIKQRLDFSCGIFDWNGKVLANAPHIPVHLGSMQTAVKQQIKRGIKSGQSILTNHPIAGGSHLPDLTVVTCFEVEKGFNIFVASRGHHADIGGISPGSMPPFSKFLDEQGLAVEKFELTNQNNEFKEQQTRQLFKYSRKIDDNISDLLAQVAANKIGIKLLLRFIRQESVQKFKTYVGFICQNAATCVQNLLVDFSLKNKFKQIDSVQNSEYMDDGTQLKLKLTIDRNRKRAIFDFTGTGCQIFGNTNAPYSITRSAILYCLRSLIGKEIPLNSGCLQPIQIIVPQQTILSPSRNSAVVGGNVQTSQRIVDLILKPFNVVAASQGTMNNFLFGNQKISYYETIAGGTGAGQGFEGKTCQVHMTNTRITDVQHLEQKYPVILNKFSLRQNSGGQGKYKGGNGIIREFIFLEPLQVSVLSQRRVFRPYGLNGGASGQRGRNIFIKYSQQEEVQRSLGSKNIVNVHKFDRIRIQTPGGGGYGTQKSQQQHQK